MKVDDYILFWSDFVFILSSIPEGYSYVDIHKKCKDTLYSFIIMSTLIFMQAILGVVHQNYVFYMKLFK